MSQVSQTGEDISNVFRQVVYCGATESSFEKYDLKSLKNRKTKIPTRVTVSLNLVVVSVQDAKLRSSSAASRVRLKSMMFNFQLI